ncbi:hypothetical protein MRY87_13150 [bacterium]|nr:hypothetical protein [bacterium]
MQRIASPSQNATETTPGYRGDPLLRPELLESGHLPDTSALRREAVSLESPFTGHDIFPLLPQLRELEIRRHYAHAAVRLARQEIPDLKLDEVLPIAPAPELSFPELQEAAEKLSEAVGMPVLFRLRSTIEDPIDRTVLAVGSRSFCFETNPFTAERELLPLTMQRFSPFQEGPLTAEEVTVVRLLERRCSPGINGLMTLSDQDFGTKLEA